MSGLDIFAWIVLIILVASVIAVFCIAGWLPGHIAKTRGHPWAEAVTVAGWVTLICGFALWPIALIWAYVDVRGPRRSAPNDRGDALRISRTAVWLGEILSGIGAQAGPGIQEQFRSNSGEQTNGAHQPADFGKR